jgi:hypothetical protein
MLNNARHRSIQLINKASQPMSQSAYRQQKNSLKPQTASNADVEAL